jgi:hypothetical protein
MEPIVGAKEVVQVGPLVVGRDVTNASKRDFKFSHGGALNMMKGR